jgi:bifunctional non-homologous end joining protein LigD
MPVHARSRSPAFSNLSKVLYPSGFTKGEVIDYYRRIAPVLLPHVRDRAITLKRYPNGSTSDFFFEKNCPVHRPGWVKTATVPSRRSEEGVNHCVLTDERSLLWVANLAALELHVPLAKISNPQRPTAMVFDLDPGPPAGLRECLQVGLRLRDVLAHLGLQCFPKTSGGKGLHVYVPLNTPGLTFEDTKAFAHAIASVFVKQNPAETTATMTKALRPGKVFIDWSQNDQHKTTAAAYTLRAREEPTASAPVTWDEVEHAARRNKPLLLVFTAPQVLRRAETLGDLFEPVLKLKQRLPGI